MRQVITTVAPRAASAGERAGTPPRASCSRMRSGAMSYPRTVKPALIRLPARAEPSRPIPRYATTAGRVRSGD